MSIASTDVKLLKSQRLTDEDDGGGRATGTAVVDAEVNNLFPDLSRLDRTIGRINLRKGFAGVMTDNADPYLGAHAIITQAPADPRVSALLFSTGSQSDERADARDAIESYVAAASAAAFELLGTQLAGQRAIACVQREEQRVPEVGEVYQLSATTGAQYVRITAVEPRLEQFTYEISQGNFLNFTRRRLDLSLSGPLQYTFPGGQVTPAGTTATALDGRSKAQVLGTQVADAARYYGISPLAQACAVGDMTLRVQSVYAQLVPSTTKESALVDLLAGYQRQINIPSGPLRSLSVTLAAGAVAGESRTHLGTGIAPGSLTITANGGTYADTRTGALRHVSGSNWLTAGRVDYQTGEVTLVRTGSSWTGTGSVSYQPGASATSDVITGEVEITLGNRGYVYTLSLTDAVPRAGTLSVSYMALGTWYELRDAGDGLLVGEGAGTINFSTGSVSLTLDALPDAGTSLVWYYVSSADNAITQRAGGSIVPVLEARYTLPHTGILPGSVTVEYTAGSLRSLTDDGAGNLSGTGGTGRIIYATGEVLITLAATPSAGITYSYQQGDVASAVQTVASDGSGMATFTLPGAPLRPGSVQASWVTSRRQARPAINADAMTVYDGTIDVARSAADNGSGGWRDGVLGSIDYATGACTLQVAALYSYTEYLYSNPARTSGGAGVEHKETKPQLTTTPITVRETFGGAITLRAQASGELTESRTANQAQPPITFDLLPGIGEAIVPGSLLFSWGGSTYADRSGILYRDISSATGGGTAVGSVDYAAGTAELTSYPGNASGAASLLACLTATAGFAVTATTFRTPGAPLRPGSLQLTVVRGDTAQVVTATSDINGNLSGGIIHGTVDATTGIVRVRYTTDPDDATGASDVPVIPLMTRYNAVVQSVLPLDAGLLGLDPVRLPSDGRVPIYREGAVLVIHHSSSTPVASPTAGATLQLDRSQQAAIEVFDANGLALRASSYSVDLEAGSLSWSNPLLLQAEDGAPLTLPLTVRDRVEHMTLCTEVQITGEVSISSPLPWALPAGEAHVSSAVAWGDLQSRLHSWYTQQTWSQGTPNWTDAPVGNTTTAQYNSLGYPPVITNAGAIDGKWALVFTSSSAFNVVEEKLGVITTGTITSDCSPINALTGQPYFLIKKEGWGSGWAAANAVRFNTASALGPLWIIRTVISGQGTVDDDQIKLQIRGDAD